MQVCGFSDLDEGNRSELRGEKNCCVCLFVFIFILSCLECPQKKRVGHEDFLEAKRRRYDAKAVSCHSSNFWLEPPQKGGLEVGGSLEL